MIIRAGGVSKPTFSPKLMTGIGELPQTVRDRSFRFDMLRATRDEKPERLTPLNRRALQLEGSNIRFALNVFAERHTSYLADAEPELPDALDDRAQDISEPLLAIADLVGGVWPEQSRTAMIKVRSAMFKTEADQDLVLLLRDIREIFSVMPALYSRTLVKRLREIEEHP